MKQQLLVTDLTRMQRGYVCVATLDTQCQVVRLATPRFHESRLVRDGRAVIFPGALVECEVGQNRPDPPHTEDYDYEPDSLKFTRRLEPADW